MPVSHGRHHTYRPSELEEKNKDLLIDRLTEAANYIEKAKNQLEKGSYVVVSHEIAEEINRLTRKRNASKSRKKNKGARR